MLRIWMLVVVTLFFLINLISLVPATEKPGIGPGDMSGKTQINPEAIQSMKPDLIVESFSAPASVTQSEMISQKIKITVKNIGGSEANDFIVAIILKGTVVNPGWPTQYHILGLGTIAGLKAGKSAPVTMQKFSAGTIVPPKQYEICSIADEGKQVNESNENNNWSRCQLIDINP